MTTKGERNNLGGTYSLTDAIVMHYRDMARSMFVWEGLDSDGLEDMPYGFIEGEALFFNRGFAIKKVKGMGLCGLGCEPSTYDIYGRPHSWLPSVYGWTLSGAHTEKSSDVFKESDTPVLWNHQSMMNRISPYVQIMTRALNTLNVNLAALNHPILVSGVAGNPGDNVGSILLKNALYDGDTMIPVVKPDAVGLNAIDLGVTDNSQNLISVVDWADSRIRAVMGIGTGVEKSSGIGAFDEKGVTGMATQTDSALEIRTAWAEKVNEKFGLNITVSRNENIEKAIQDDDSGDIRGDNSSDSDDNGDDDE